MKLIYDVNQKPPIGKNLVYAFQQVLAIMAATLLVPLLVGEPLNQAAALCGAGFGTLFYIFVTRKKSPVFLGSSFAFISPLIGAAPCNRCSCWRSPPQIRCGARFPCCASVWAPCR